MDEFMGYFTKYSDGTTVHHRSIVEEMLFSKVIQSTQKILETIEHVLPRKDFSTGDLWWDMSFYRNQRTPGVSKLRKHFGPSQIRTIRGLTPGRVVELVYPEGMKQKVIVMSVNKKKKTCLFLTKGNKYVSSYLDKHFFTDKNMLPYKSDIGPVWNYTNHLLRTTTKGITHSDVEEILNLKERFLDYTKLSCSKRLRKIFK